MNPHPSSEQNSGLSIRVFQNPFLEKLTHVHPIVPLVLWLPIVLACYSYSLASLRLPLTGVIVSSAFALLLWTLSEYLLHRVVFHHKAKSKFGKRLVFLFHGIHHDDPHDATRLVMPPAPALILGGSFFLLFRVFCGPFWVYPIFAGYIIGYLIYDYTHYAIHHLQPKTAFGKYLKRYHYLHHFRETEAKWGVSSPLWDYIFDSVKTPQAPHLAATGPDADPTSARFPLRKFPPTRP